MDPLASIAASSKTSSFWVVRELSSVLAPGVVILSQLAVMIAPVSSLRERLKLDESKSPVYILALFVIVAVAWLVGYVSRELAFRFLSVTEPRSSSPTGNASATAPPARSGRFADGLRELRCAHQTPMEMRQRLVSVYGEEATEEFFRLHPLVGRLVKQPQTFDGGYRGGRHVDDAANAIFSYCKLWLRRNAPAVGVDSIELEINIIVSAVLPAMLLPLVCAFSIRGPWVFTTLAPFILGVLIVLELARAYRRLRGAERWEAIRNVAEDFLMRKAEAATQDRLVATTGPQPAQNTSGQGAATVMQPPGARSRVPFWRRR